MDKSSQGSAQELVPTDSNARSSQALQDRSRERTFANWLSSPSVWNIAIWIILLSGIGLRASQLALNRSLFLDEAFVATNIQERGYLSLLDALKFDQRAPAAFLWSVKCCWDVLGHDDWILRLTPFAAGVASLFLFRRLLSQTLELPYQLLGMSLLALAVPHIFYSSDLKQYSLDVLVAMTAIWFAISPGEMTASWKQSLLCGGLGCAAFLGSFVSIFILGSIGLVMLWQRRGCWDIRLIRLLVVFSMWGFGFGLIYLVQVRNFDLDPDWKWLWGDAFLRTSLFSLDGLSWLRDRLAHVATNPSGLAPSGLAVFLMFYGAITLARKNPVRSMSLLGPILAVLLAAVIGVYPFKGRAILFTAPSVIILVCYGVQEQSKLHREGLLVLVVLAALSMGERGVELVLIGASAFITYVWRDCLRFEWLVSPLAFRLVRTGFVCIALLAIPIKDTARHLKTGASYNNPMFWGYRLEELKPIMQYVRDHWREGDKVYLYSQTNVAFEFYASRFGFKPEDWTNGMMAGLFKPSQEQIRSDFEPLVGQPRLWVLFTHVGVSGGDSDREEYVRCLDSFGQRLSERVLDGRFDASAYLYDLSSSNRVANLPH
jgi:hypothetical protein